MTTQTHTWRPILPVWASNIVRHCCFRGHQSEQRGSLWSERKPTEYPEALNSGMHQQKREYAPIYNDCINENKANSCRMYTYSVR